MPDTLLEIATRVGGFTHGSTKPPQYYEIYESYFSAFRDKAGLKLLEVGVHSGESLKAFSEYFPQGDIVGVDLVDRGIDFSQFGNVTFIKGDQADEAELTRIAVERAPDGFDIIIDDASHIGAYSLITFKTLLPHLKSGGLYVIEDWGTGYVEDWPDGGPYKGLQGRDWRFPIPFWHARSSHMQAFGREPGVQRWAQAIEWLIRRTRYKVLRMNVIRPPLISRMLPRDLPSHSRGMVGFVKSLVDEVWAECIKPSIDAPDGRAGALHDLHVHRGLVVVRKR